MSESGLARGGAWQVLTARGARICEAETSGGACDAVSGRSWLGFTRDWMFYLSMPVIWQLNAQNVDIRVLQYCGRDGGGSLLTVTIG